MSPAMPLKQSKYPTRTPLPLATNHEASYSALLYRTPIRSQDQWTATSTVQPDRKIAMTLALMLAAIGLHSPIFAGATALVGWSLGAIVEEVAFSSSPVLFRFTHRGVMYVVGLIPLGAHVRFKGDRDKPKSTQELLFAADMEPPGFNDLHPLKRVLIALSACAGYFVVAMVCLGPWIASRSLARGFVQAFPFAPWTPAWVPGGRDLAGHMVSLFRDGPFPTALGVFMAKLAALNLLPIPPLAGGMSLMYLLGWKKGLPEKYQFAATYVGMLVCLLAMGYWTIQFASVLLGKN